MNLASGPGAHALANDKARLAELGLAPSEDEREERRARYRNHQRKLARASKRAAYSKRPVNNQPEAVPVAGLLPAPVARTPATGAADPMDLIRQMVGR